MMQYMQQSIMIMLNACSSLWNHLTKGEKREAEPSEIVMLYPSYLNHCTNRAIKYVYLLNVSNYDSPVYSTDMVGGKYTCARLGYLYCNKSTQVLHKCIFHQSQLKKLSTSFSLQFCWKNSAIPKVLPKHSKVPWTDIQVLPPNYTITLIRETISIIFS